MWIGMLSIPQKSELMLCDPAAADASRKRNCLSAANSHPTQEGATSCFIFIFHSDTFASTFSGSNKTGVMTSDRMMTSFMPMIDPVASEATSQMGEREGRQKNGVWIGRGWSAAAAAEANIPIYSSNGRLGPPLAFSPFSPSLPSLRGIEYGAIWGETVYLNISSFTGLPSRAGGALHACMLAMR